MSPLQTVKFWLVEHVALGKDALHVYVALIVFFGACLMFGWRVRDWRPLLLVAAVALLGEAWDMRDRVVEAIPQNPGGNLKDLWNTLFWPAGIMLLARTSRVLDRREQALE